MESNIKNPTPNSGNDSSESFEILKKDYQDWRRSATSFIKEILDIREKTDKKTTVDEIKEDIPFKGHNAWILVCSIFVASVGLNANSTAVVIGAMLISPLMGPILGIGLGVAINDIETLRRAFLNFTVMVVLSLLTAFFFFYVFPLKEDSSELLARTAPDVRDVLIAFFGGLALIIARTKQGTIASVIFGVAIATALMPPLCTAGYGLAIGKWSYFFGAMYLFLINTIFIALATYIVLKLLRFPLVKYANQKIRKKTVRLISAVAILAMIPAIWTFYNVFQESLFYSQAKDFIATEIESTTLPGDGRFVMDLSESYYDRQTKDTKIELVFMGEANISEPMIETWKTKMKEYSNLKNTELTVVQGTTDQELQNYKYMVELYENMKDEIQDKEKMIRLLQDDLSDASKNIVNIVPYKDIMKKAYINYPALDKISYSQRYVAVNPDSLDTIYIFNTYWKEGVDEDQKNDLNRRFKQYLQVDYPQLNLNVE